jgi:hypothetical protein
MANADFFMYYGAISINGKPAYSRLKGVMKYCSTVDVRVTYEYRCDTISTVTKQQLTVSQTRTALLLT